ncbi:glycogen/starch synthase, partial [bacterium]|nr:glycogen/starch synthase [bacterium]
MKRSLKILMVFSEIYPFAKTRDLSDVGGSLPKALKEMGHDVRVITPQYRVTNERKYVLRDVIRLQNINVPMGKKTLCVNVKSAFLPNSKVQVYFIDYKPFYFREGIYNNPKSGVPYSDNDKRFILFSKVVLKTLIKLQWQPDVIHCNDWQSGLVPFFLKTVYKEDPFFSKTYSLFTVHDFECQGNFNLDCKSDIAMDLQGGEFDKGIQLNGKCNFLKA